MPFVRSGRALATALGVNEGSVRKAMKRGAVPREPDGTFDVERCRATWDAKTDPARTKVRKGAHHGAQSELDGPHVAVRTEADARKAVTLISAVLQAEGVEAGGVIDFNAARTAETILRAHKRDLELKVRRGELVEIEDVGAEVERDYATVRTRLMAMPGKLAAKLVGLDLHAIRLAILDEITEALTELNAPAVAAGAAVQATGRR